MKIKVSCFTLRGLSGGNNMRYTWYNFSALFVSTWFIRQRSDKNIYHSFHNFPYISKVIQLSFPLNYN